MIQPVVKPFRISFSEREVNKFLSLAKEILVQGKLIPGKNNLELEKLFADLIGARFGVAVNSGSSALEIIARSLGLANKEVLIPSNTNYATAEAIIRAGALPVLYDSDIYPDFINIRELITNKTKAIVIVHIGGYITPQIKDIQKFCQKNRLYLIEDASHAHGSKYENRPAGSFGIASAFSMFATKVITTSEGGIIVTNDEKIRDRSLVYRDQGKDKTGLRSIVFGGSWRLSELHAALGVVQMQHLANYLKRNNEIITYYKTHIIQNKISIPFDRNVYYSGYKFIMLLPSREDRDSLKKHLLKKNIVAAKGVYEVSLHQQPVLKKLNQCKYPKAERFSQTHLCLPIWKSMSNAEIKRVVAAVNEWSK